MTTVKRIGHWPLMTDCNDTTDYGRHGEGHAVTFEDGAVFDGVQSAVRLPGVRETDGSQPFTMSMEFNVEDGHGYLPGGLCSRYSNESMRGWHLSVLTQTGVTSTQANLRNLQFGWNTSTPVDEWRDWGSPGHSRFIVALCVFNGGLYAGTFDDERDNKGHVHRLGDNGEWIDCGHPDDSNAVAALAEFNGKLYAGTMRYRAAGSLLPESPNQEPGGRIYRYEGGSEWTLIGQLPVPDSDSVGALVVYENRLIAMSFYPYGIFAYAEDGSYESLGAPGNNLRTHTLGVHQGELYVGCNQSGGVYKRTLHTPWTYCGTAPHVVQVYCFTTYHDELLMGIWDEGRMLRYDGDEQWSNRGLLGQEQEVMGVSVYNGRLYAGTLPGGHVYRYAGNTNWEFLKEVEPPSELTPYRRVWSMAVYDGSLFVGTLPEGKVWSLRNDPLATSDKSLSPGWHRAAVTYDMEKLSLYVDGQLVSSSAAAFPATGEPLLADIPLMLGTGPQCHYSGKLRDVELFDGALAADDIAQLHGGTERL